MWSYLFVFRDLSEWGFVLKRSFPSKFPFIFIFLIFFLFNSVHARHCAQAGVASELRSLDRGSKYLENSFIFAIEARSMSDMARCYDVMFWRREGLQACTEHGQAWTRFGFGTSKRCPDLSNKASALKLSECNIWKTKKNKKKKPKLHICSSQERKQLRAGDPVYYSSIVGKGAGR